MDSGSQVSQIEQVPVTMGGFGVNVYIIHAPGGDIIVDAGAEPEKILAAIKEPVAAILVTHGHADHIGALEDIRGATQAPVHMHPDDAEPAGITGYEPFQDGQDLVIAGEMIHVIHTPGHCPGSVTLVISEDQVVGDLIMPGSVGRTDIGGAKWEDLEVSIRKVMPLWTENTRLYAGHGDVMHALSEMKSNPYLPPVLPSAPTSSAP
ncbi:MAG: MBL fold metallo-hydrolase [Rubrobacter sp.]